MSTKTTFKRIALVAVAALGLGVLSVAPSSATATGVAITVGDAGSSTLSADSFTSDSTTAATFSVAGLLDNVNGDTVTVSFVTKTAVVGTTTTPRMYFFDSTTATSGTSVDSATALAAAYIATGSTNANQAKNVASASDVTTGVAEGAQFRITTSKAGYVGAKFGIQLDSATARVAGTTVYTVIVKSYSSGVTTPVTSTADVSITIAKAASASTAPSALKSYAVLTTTSADPGNVADSAITAVSTASATAIGYVYVALRNANASSAAVDSITASITGAGLLSVGGVTGSSFKIAATGDQAISILPDGRAGVASITIATSVTSYTAKSVTFFAKAAKTITASINNPTLVLGANSKAIKATAVDANGTAWTGAMYIYAVAAADALVGGSATTPVACSYDSVKLVHYCPVTTIAAGTANFKLIDASTVALATATSDAVAVKVSVATASSVKIAFDKSSYQPFEKAYITVTPLDSTGATLGGQAFTGLLASGGITSTQGFGSQSDTLTASALTTSADSSSTAPRTAGSYTYTVYMPAQGTVTISATGGTSLALAGQVAVTASATISNSAVDAATDAANEATDAANAATDAALAAADAADAATAAAQDASDAVAALSATVATLVASLKAQITSLTNLVIKIQKKVKA